MRARGALSTLLLLGSGTCAALSLRSSTAEVFLGEFAPGTTAVLSRSPGGRLKLTNSGTERLWIEFRATAPADRGLKDGYDPWPDPERVRLEPARVELGPGQTAEVEVAVPVPKARGPSGGQYEFDVLATARDPAGASLTLRTRTLLAVAQAQAAGDGSTREAVAERPGFVLTPTRAGPVAASWQGIAARASVTVKVVNAGDEDLTVLFSPAREWDASAPIPTGRAPAPNPAWVRAVPPVLTVKAGRIASVRIVATIPRQPRYASRRWAFVVAADAVAGGRRTRRDFVLDVETPDWAQSPTMSGTDQTTQGDTK